MLDNIYEAFADELNKLAAKLKPRMSFDEFVRRKKNPSSVPPVKKQPTTPSGMEGMGIPEVGTNRRIEPNPQGKGATVKRADILKRVPGLPAPKGLFKIKR